MEVDLSTSYVKSDEELLMEKFFSPLGYVDEKFQHDWISTPLKEKFYGSRERFDRKLQQKARLIRQNTKSDVKSFDFSKFFEDKPQTDSDLHYLIFMILGDETNYSLTFNSEASVVCFFNKIFTNVICDAFKKFIAPEDLIIVGDATIRCEGWGHRIRPDILIGYKGTPVVVVEAKTDSSELREKYIKTLKAESSSMTSIESESSHTEAKAQLIRYFQFEDLDPYLICMTFTGTSYAIYEVDKTEQKLSCVQASYLKTFGDFVKFFQASVNIFRRIHALIVGKHFKQITQPPVAKIAKSNTVIVFHRDVNKVRKQTKMDKTRYEELVKFYYMLNSEKCYPEELIKATKLNFIPEYGVVKLSLTPIGGTVGDLNEQEAIRFYENILVALAYLHQHKIAHRDVRIRNTIMRKNNFVLIDLEMMYTLNSTSGSFSVATPPIYEDKEERKKYEHTKKGWTAACDIYCLGEICFKGAKSSKIVKSIRNEMRNFEKLSSEKNNPAEYMIGFIKKIKQR